MTDRCHAREERLRNALLWLLRIFAYLFHLLLGLFLIALGIAGWAHLPNNLTLDMLPWKGHTLTWVVLSLGIVAILCVLLAIAGFLRWLLPLWALFAFVMMFRGFYLSGYAFPDRGQFHNALWLTCGALIALLGSLTVLGRKRRSGY